MSTQTPCDERAATVIDHLEELRTRLLICLGALAVTVTLALARAQAIVDWLRRPAGHRLPLLAFFSPTEALVAYLHVGVVGGLVLAVPVILWQLWGFVKPALSGSERRWGLIVIGGGTALFAAGMAFAYFVVLPVTLTVLLEVGKGTLLPMISVSKYLSFTATILLAGGFIFELPLLLAVLAALGLVTAQGLRRRWPIALLAITILSAVLTPTTDALTLLIMMVPLIALYGASILLIGRIPMKGR